MLYPSFSDYWNALHQSRAVTEYAEEVSKIDPELKAGVWASAAEYNELLKTRNNPYTLTEELRQRYENELRLYELAAMAYIDIPAIDVLLPVYHGTEDNVLQRAIGHLDWSSLPVGGEGTHVVLSGHRGLPSARLFTDLSKLVVGDVFMLQVLDETLTYEVDQILVVEPEDVATLVIEPEADLCTLVTCTPYGINTHRLLVRGHRIENLASAKMVRLVSEAMQVEPMIVAVTLALPMLLALLVIFLVRDAKHTANRRRNGRI